MPQAPVTVAAEAGAPAEAKTESFFCNFFEPQCGHSAEPSHFTERTSSSKFLSHLSQLNSKIGMGRILPVFQGVSSSSCACFVGGRTGAAT